MKEAGRYKVPVSEDYEPSSNDCVLRNLLGITSKEEMDLIEAQELKQVELELIEIYSESYQFSAKDVCDIHKLWLKNIYTMQLFYIR